MRHIVTVIELVRGPMFSGKTTRLLRFVEQARGADANVVVCKPDRDTRSVGVLSSHDGDSCAAISIRSPESLRLAAGGADIVVLDEAHLVGEATIEALIELSEAGCRVVVAGLDLDFRREPFSGTARLQEVATSVERLYAACGICGVPAAFTQRLVAGQPAPLSDPTVVIGGEEAYQARCDACWRRERTPSDLVR